MNMRIIISNIQSKSKIIDEIWEKKMKDVNNNDVVLNQNQMKKEILNLTNKLDVQELVYSKTLSKYEEKLTLLSFNVSQQNSKIENIEKEKKIIHKVHLIKFK